MTKQVVICSAMPLHVVSAVQAQFIWNLWYDHSVNQPIHM